MPRRRAKRAASSAASSARITPRLPDNIVGFTTHGKRVAAAMAAGSSERLHRLNAGDGTPAAANRHRIRCLSRAASAASGALCGRPRAWLARAASRVPESSSPTMAATGTRRAKATTASVERTRSR